MNRLLGLRFLSLIPTIFGVVTLVFLTIHLIPGDPIDVMLGETALPAEKTVLRHNLKLDRPVSEQYMGFISGLFAGDLGRSIKTGRPVMEEIASRWPATLELALAALLLAVPAGIVCGLFSAASRGGYFDRVSLSASVLGQSVPVFWSGPVLMIVFSIWLGWLPVSGREGFLGLVLPAVTLAIGMGAVIYRLTRSSVIEVVSEDFIRSARARGVAEWKVYSKHALSNALLPVVTATGLQMGALLSGAVITETVFSWPGVGRLLIDAIEARDYPLVQGCVLNISIAYVGVNLVTDWLYSVVDPRVRL